MPWVIYKRRIGRAGGFRERHARQAEWDREFGEGLWAIGYVLDGEFVTGEDAFERVYYRSYAEHFERHPDDLAELLACAGDLHNPHAAATSGVDLQVPAIRLYLQRHGLQLQGHDRVDIGSWRGQASHAISVRLSPLQIRAAGQDKMTLERFWQAKKRLAVWR
ncbi:MAG: hypothetical protein H6713_19805 [Myxococcales bacterium]|nr:hypothetical protein [Myxococcales bacterium]